MVNSLSFQMQLARSFCFETSKKANLALEEIIAGETMTPDAVYKNIAETLFANKGYCAAHPLQRNY